MPYVHTEFGEGMTVQLNEILNTKFYPVGNAPQIGGKYQ